MLKYHRGMSLVSLMVGIFVSMMLMLVAAGTFSFFDAQRRMTLGTDSAIQEGLAGLMDIQREAANTGAGLFYRKALSCLTFNAAKSGVAVANNVVVGPALIKAGASSKASDSISFFSLGSLSSGAANQLAGTPDSAVGSISVYSANAFKPGGYAVLATPGSTAPCTLMQVSTVTTSAAGTELGRAVGAATPWNPASAAIFANPQSYSEASIAFGLGGLPDWKTYAVNANRLEVTNNLTASTQVLASGVVLMRAYYGISASGESAISSWEPATGAWAGPFSADQLKRIRALRIAVVTQAQQPERPDAEGNCTTTVAAPVAWENGPAIDLSGIENWKCYRYKTFTTIAPLTNVIFGG